MRACLRPFFGARGAPPGPLPSAAYALRWHSGAAQVGEVPQTAGAGGAAATTRLYVVRHGAVIPPGGRKGAVYGGAEVELSEQGKLEARAAAEYLRGKAPYLDAVYSSRLTRAIYGAERICEGRGLNVMQDERFNEIDRGVWYGLTRDEIVEKFPDHVKAIGSVSGFEADPHFTGHGGENYRGVQRRVSAGRDAVLQANPGATVALVCHNWVVSAIIGDAMGVVPEQWHTLRIPTASISLLEITHQPQGDGSIIITDQQVSFAGLSPAEYTNGRLKDNLDSAMTAAGKG